MNTRVYKFKCPSCGKEIESLSKNQFDFNVALHKASCNKLKNKEVKKNEHKNTTKKTSTNCG